MKKVIITVLALAMVIGLTSCGEKRTVSKTVTQGSTQVHVSERTYKDDELIDENNYVIDYDTPEEAWNAVYNK